MPKTSKLPSESPPQSSSPVPDQPSSRSSISSRSSTSSRSSISSQPSTSSRSSTSSQPSTSSRSSSAQPQQAKRKRASDDDTEVKQLKKKLRRYQQELKEKDNEIMTLKKAKSALEIKQLYYKYTSGNAHTFNEVFSVSFRKMRMPNFTWKIPNDKLIKKAWKLLKKSEKRLDEVVEMDTEAKMQVVVMRMLNSMKEFLFLTIALHDRATMIEPALKPDVSLTHEEAVKPNWPDLTAIIENKLPTVNLVSGAQQQTVGYLAHAYSPLTDAPTRQHSCFAACLNFRQIMVFRFADDDLRFGEKSGPAPLFPENWKNLKEPTEGFTWLCSLLSVPSPGATTVVIDGYEVKSISTIYQSRGSQVHRVLWNGAEMVVKIFANEKYALGLLKMECVNWSAMYNESTKDCLIRFETSAEVKNGIMMEAGVPLMHVVSEYWQANKDAELLPSVLGYLAQAFDAIRTLHTNGWFHGDVRPANFVIVDGKIRLIDFVTAGLIDSSGFVRQGELDPFQPEERSGCGFSKFLPKWDFIGLAYTIMWIGSSGKNRRRRFESIEERDAYIQKKNTSKDPIIHAARVIYHYVNNLQGGTMNDLFYHDIRKKAFPSI